METLFAGDVSAFNDEHLRTMFGNDNIVVCSKKAGKKRIGKIKRFPVDVADEHFSKLFDNYRFDRVIYVSAFTKYKSNPKGELDSVRKFMDCCAKNHIEKVVVVSSGEILRNRTDSQTMYLHALEALCMLYARNKDVTVKIIRSPYIFAGYNPDLDDFCYKFIDALQRGGLVHLDVNINDKPYFVDPDEIAELIYRIFDDWNSESGTFDIHPIETRSYKDLELWVKRLYPKADLVFDQVEKETQIELTDNKLRSQYGWYIKRDALDMLDDYREEFVKIQPDKQPLLRQIIDRFRVYDKFTKIVELILGALLVEFLVRMSYSGVQFRMVDFRTIYVVIMASVYGSNVGVLAAGIEIIMLIISYYTNGTAVELLFYDPANWIPFIILMILGAAVGYLKEKKEVEITSLKDEIGHVNDQYDFMNMLYEEAIDYKNQYKKELLGSREGFGRIFDVVNRLNSTDPQEIFADAVPVLEELLESESVAIFTIGAQSSCFARLEVCSKKLNDKINKSLRLDGEYQEILDSLSDEDVWFNSSLNPKLPVYVTGVRDEGRISVLIFVYNSDFSQLSAYYVNLLRIFKGLMQNFLVKAWRFMQATREQIYYSGTEVAKKEYLLNQIQIHKGMKDQGLLDYRIIHVFSDGRSFETMAQFVADIVRVEDVIGRGDDGDIYVLTPQVDENNIIFVTRRFENEGIRCEIVKEVN